MRYTVITAHTRTVPQQAWIKRRFVWKSSPQHDESAPLCLFLFSFLTCCLSKCSLSAPRLASTRLLFTRVGTCLMLFILPVLHDELFQRELIHRFYKKKKKGEKHTYITVFLLLSSLQTPGCLCVCVTGRHLHTAASLLGDASRLKEEEQMSVCASYYAFGSSPKVEEIIIIIIIIMSSASRHPLTPHDSIVCIYHTSGMTSVFLLFCF